MTAERQRTTRVESAISRSMSAPVGVGDVVEVEAGEEVGDGFSKLGAHLLFLAGVGEAAARVLVGVVDREPVHDEPLAERCHDGVVLVDRGGGCLRQG